MAPRSASPGTSPPPQFLPPPSHPAPPQLAETPQVIANPLIRGNGQHVPGPSVVEAASEGTPFPDIVTSPPSPGSCVTPAGHAQARKQGQHSSIAKSVMSAPQMARSKSGKDGDMLSPETALTVAAANVVSDTPLGTAPNSPRIRATTIDVPGLTKSKVSPDGRIASRDLGSKLVIVMVGLPARGKSYVTKKLARYLNWLQHDTRIFNVGNRRRVAAGAVDHFPPALQNGFGNLTGSAGKGTRLLLDGTKASLHPAELVPPHAQDRQPPVDATIEGGMDQSAAFFDPNNKAAAELREKVALETLDELLNYVLYEGGSVGILDATNSSLARRKAVLDRIRQVAGQQIGVVFLESECNDEQLLEANMRLKLQGPDYRDQDPVKALEDFKKRVAMYKQSYVSLGDYEEKLGMQYIKMIDVGRKVIAHQTKGFLAAQTVYFLLNFHLSPRQIWITRHGESVDNILGKIGGDASLSEEGKRYAKALTSFIDVQRKLFHERLVSKHIAMHGPPTAGDTTPPNPESYSCGHHDEQGVPLEKNFCVWTSMLKRSIETAEHFDEEEYDVKQMRMLNELNAGIAEGMTYDEIRGRWPDQYEERKKDKLRYRYPGAGGESYLDVVNRLRAVIVEVERMQDHVLLVAHRVVARVLLAYFLGLQREDVASLDVPLGTLYMLEPKPYGVEFNVYQYDPNCEWFHHQEDFKLKSDSDKDVKINK